MGFPEFPRPISHWPLIEAFNLCQRKANKTPTEVEEILREAVAEKNVNSAALVAGCIWLAIKTISDSRRNETQVRQRGYDQLGEFSVS